MYFVPRDWTEVDSRRKEAKGRQEALVVRRKLTAPG